MAETANSNRLNEGAIDSASHHNSDVNNTGLRGQLLEVRDTGLFSALGFLECVAVHHSPPK